MKSLPILAGLAAITMASPAFAHHLVGNTTPFATRGECEAYMAEGMPEDIPGLLQAFPNFFNSYGDLASFLTKAWTCELNEDDGQWYITDHRWDVLNSDWYQRHH